MINPSDINLSQFITNWYGPRDSPKTFLGPEYSWLPRPLREWHALASQWTRPIIADNKMIPLMEISPREGKAIFMTDSSRDWLWSFDASNPSQVYDAELHHPWEPCSESLEELLIHTTIREGVNNANSFRLCPEVKVDLIPQIIAPTTEVAFGEWRWPVPGYRTFMSEFLVINVGPAPSFQASDDPRCSFWSIEAGSNHQDHLAYLDKLGINWMK
ncbi:hypothetical protein [Kitasatospora phosalacinea]|uniref:hypothetical protein n=1 Tax=Kitasatospora phosalacinea TaxID=2065 RepID=UPI00131E6C44|nr:hypothetical protein [Kitasatospora phosalacinea]